MKKYWILLLCIFIFPFGVFAYSNQVFVGGNTIGIEVHGKGVSIVGFYDVLGKSIAEDAGFKIGDIIPKLIELISLISSLSVIVFSKLLSKI